MIGENLGIESIFEELGSFFSTVGKAFLPIRDCSRGLIISNNAQNPDHQVDVKADEIILQDEQFRSFRVTEVDFTLDITKKGVNGLDTGTEAAYTWYYIWIISKSKGKNVAGILSTSSSSPTMPSGYTYKAFVGAIHNCRNVGNDFGPMKQVGRKAARNSEAVINSGTATTATPINCSNALPEKAISAIGIVQINIASGGGLGRCWIRSAPDQGCVEFSGYYHTQGFISASFCIPVIESQTIYYNKDSTYSNAESITVSISGYEF